MLLTLLHTGLNAHQHPHSYDHLTGTVFAVALLLALTAAAVVALARADVPGQRRH